MIPFHPYKRPPITEIKPAFSIRTRQEMDVPAIRSLMTRAYPPPHGPEAVWSAERLLAHLRVFPEGQLVALTGDGRIVGSATSMRVSPERALAPHTWQDITGNGLLTGHEPDGSVLYGVNVVVDPEWQGQGVARKLYQARLDLARRSGCRWIVAGARIPGYLRVADHLTPAEYVEKVVKGELHDPTLSKQLHMGFRVKGLLPDYAFDAETLGFAALIVLPVEDTHEV